MYNDSKCRVGSEIDDDPGLRRDVRSLTGDENEMYRLVDPRAVRDTQTGAVDREGRIERCQRPAVELVVRRHILGAEPQGGVFDTLAQSA